MISKVFLIVKNYVPVSSLQQYSVYTEMEGNKKGTKQDHRSFHDNSEFLYPKKIKRGNLKEMNGVVWKTFFFFDLRESGN